MPEGLCGTSISQPLALFKQNSGTLKLSYTYRNIGTIDTGVSQLSPCCLSAFDSWSLISVLILLSTTPHPMSHILAKSYKILSL